ncbi:MAG TPA: GNAT family N-acetyltransferase [Actinomycetales bacterium]
MSDLELVPVDPTTDDELLGRWVEAQTAVSEHAFGDRHTAYSLAEVRTQLRLTTDYAVELVAAVRDGVVVGAGRVDLPLRDNPTVAAIRMGVRPEHRRQGIGAALLAELESRALAAGRRTLISESEVAVGGTEPATTFAPAHGYTAALHELRSDLDLPDDLDAMLVPLEADAQAHSAGYELLTWWDGVPAEWLTQRAELSTRMSTDAPFGDLDIEEERWDEERVAQQGRIAREQGRRLVETVALETATGRLVAFTLLAVAEHTPQLAYQWDTLVLREHRGHRLGQLVKAANLRALLAGLPQVRRVVTWNAGVNEPMLRVNRAMGFEVVGSMTEWQKQLPD